MALLYGNHQHRATQKDVNACYLPKNTTQILSVIIIIFQFLNIILAGMILNHNNNLKARRWI